MRSPVSHLPCAGNTRSSSDPSSHSLSLIGNDFPRVLGHYSRELGLFSLETAVHKMSGLSARNFKLEDRGEIREGAYADLVVFDAATIKDVATFEEPIALAVGIDCVLVYDAIAYRSGQVASQRSGRFLRRRKR